MKKILLAIGFFVALNTEAQVVNKFRDSSVFFKGVRFDSTLVFKGLKAGSTADTNVVVISSTGKASKVSKSAFLGDLPIYSISDSNTVINYDVLNSQNTPPVSPSTGDVYLVGTSPSGAWVGHAKDIAEWNGSAWVFTDGVQGDFLYNATNALTYIFRSGNWVQTTGIPALNNGNTISSGLRIGTNNARSLMFETNNINRGRFDSVGRFYVYDTSLRKSNKYLQIDSITGRLVASEISGGSASSSLFPNGIEIVNASRAFLSSDSGKMLFLLQDVNITFDNVFEDLSTLGVFCVGNNTVEMENGSVVSAANGEFLHLIYGGDGLAPISSFKYDGKTALRYLYDKSQNAIPLSGTEVGKPATGAVEFKMEDGVNAISLYNYNNQNTLNITAGGDVGGILIIDGNNANNNTGYGQGNIFVNRDGSDNYVVSFPTYQGAAEDTFVTVNYLSNNTLNFATQSALNDTASSLHILIDAKVSTTTLTDSLAKKTNKLIAFSSYTTSDTLRLTDADKVIEMNVGSANNLVIPTNTAYAFPVGTQIVLIQIGAGQTTLVPASGVTVRSSSSKLKLTGQYSGATLIKKNTNEWYLFGDITN